jgi:hypothetical protein
MEQKKRFLCLLSRQKDVPLQPGKSYTASSQRFLQGLTAAKVAGCSGAM